MLDFATIFLYTEEKTWRYVMETYFYKCPECGFVYQVPDYWVSFSPDETYDFPHIDFKTGEPCKNITLKLAKED